MVELSEDEFHFLKKHIKGYSKRMPKNEVEDALKDLEETASRRAQTWKAKEHQEYIETIAHEIRKKLPNTNLNIPTNKYQLVRTDKQVLEFLSRVSSAPLYEIVEYLITMKNHSVGPRSEMDMVSKIRQLVHRSYITKISNKGNYSKDQLGDYAINANGKAALAGFVDFVLTSQDIRFSTMGILLRALYDLRKYKSIIQSRYGVITGLTFPMTAREITQTLNDQRYQFNYPTPDYCVLLNKPNASFKIVKYDNVTHVRTRVHNEIFVVGNLNADIIETLENTHFNNNANDLKAIQLILPEGREFYMHTIGCMFSIKDYHNQIFGTYNALKLFDDQVRNNSITLAELRSNAFAWYWQRYRDKYTDLSPRITKFTNKMFKVGDILL